MLFISGAEKKHSQMLCDSMSDVAIQVENLSKLYRIGQMIGCKTLRESLTNACSAPFRALGSAISGQKSGGDNQRSSDSIWALKDVSFEVKQGEVVGIIGRNGSGKSTLLKILSRITSPTEGYAEIHGRVGSLLEVGTGFHPELTGRENIYLNGAILGMKKAEVERKFDEIAAFSEIEKFLDTPVKRYSSGMYVRLAFAVAAHLEPEILLVDEVLAVGDAQFQKKCLGKMDDVAKCGRTALFVSHNMVAVEGLCQHAMVLRSGELSYSGTSRDAIAFYFEGMKENLVSLKDRKGREGTGEVRAVDIKIFDEEGNEADHIRMGESFCVQIHTIGKLKKAVIGVLLGNMYRKQIVRGYTWEQLTDEIELMGSDIVRCYFENLPLMHGSYDIHIWIGQVGQLSDYVEDAATLTVVPADVYKTARIPDPLGGIAFCTVRWEINGTRYK